MLNQQLIRVVQALCEDLNSPRSLAVYLLVKNEEWAQLQQLRCDPVAYDDPDEYLRDLVPTELFRKTQFDWDYDRLHKAAIGTFWSCEAQNAKANAFLSRVDPRNPLLEGPEDLKVSDFLKLWRDEVRYILGTVPTVLDLKFGPGSTMSDKAPLTTIPDKLSKRPTATVATALALGREWSPTAWSRYSRPKDRGEIETIRGNRFFTVPKDASKRRGCCMEPSLNVAYQLSVGGAIREKLKAVGVDLRTGQDLHRTLARDASKWGHLATLDLSNASDTIPRKLVEILLPPDWRSLLGALRSPTTQVDGKTVYLEKYSSMGNGFTFELETVIFLSLARALLRKGWRRDHYPSDWVISVYGDDIIIPSFMADAYRGALSMFGFTVNTKKSYWTGPFRESCGGDFFDGTPVRAYYVEKLPSETTDWISFANGLRRIGYTDSVPNRHWSYLHRAWRRCLDAIPSDIRGYRGPTHLGDIVIHDNPSEWSVCTSQDGQLTVRAYAPVPVMLQWHHWLPDTQLAAALMGSSSIGVSPRGAISGYRRTRVPFYGTSDHEWIVRPKTHYPIRTRPQWVSANPARV